MAWAGRWRLNQRVSAGRQISLLINPWPQPASRRTIDSKKADVIKALKIFTCFPP
jgi:hypothetical protein